MVAAGNRWTHRGRASSRAYHPPARRPAAALHPRLSACYRARLLMEIWTGWLMGLSEGTALLGLAWPGTSAHGVAPVRGLPGRHGCTLLPCPKMGRGARAHGVLGADLALPPGRVPREPTEKGRAPRSGCTRGLPRHLTHRTSIFLCSELQFWLEDAPHLLYSPLPLRRNGRLVLLCATCQRPPRAPRLKGWLDAPACVRDRQLPSVRGTCSG